MSAGCYDATYYTAAFYLTVHGAIPYSGRSNSLPIRSCSTPGSVTCDAEEHKFSIFAYRAQRTAVVFPTDKGITSKSGFQFRRFRVDTFGSYGPEAKKGFDQFSEIRACQFTQSIGSCRNILCAISIAHITTSAKMLSSLSASVAQ